MAYGAGLRGVGRLLLAGLGADGGLEGGGAGGCCAGLVMRALGVGGLVSVVPGG